MSGVNWNLGLAQDVGGNAFASFQKGQEQRRVDEGRNALTGYVTNPNDDTLKALAPHQPEFVLAQKQKQQQQAQEQEERQIIGDALTNPDPAIKAQARQRLAYTNSELCPNISSNCGADLGLRRKSSIASFGGGGAAGAFCCVEELTIGPPAIGLPYCSP